MMWGFRRATRPVTVRIWNDWYPYKKAYVLQGFYELDQQREIKLEWADYKELERAGAPSPSNDTYQSHKNMVVLQIHWSRDSAVNVVYDCNDLYYKIPNVLLRWSDLYFKSNYQADYLRSGKILTGPYWDSLHFREACLPEPLDVLEASKCRPSSFSMHLTDSPKRNRRYFQHLEGAWQHTPPNRKDYDVFYLGSYWGPRRHLMDALVQQLKNEKARWLGGLVEADTPLPQNMIDHRSEPVDREKWGKMAAAARLPLMERGLDGCVSYKPAHYCLIGAPFAAMEFTSNFWAAMRGGINYALVDEDFGNVGRLIREISDDELIEMGRRNLTFWHNVLCPEATARYIIREALELW